MESIGEDRVSYQKIKAGALEAYYDFCRDRGVVKKLSHIEVLGYVDYEYENIYENSIEKLMLTVVRLVLSGGWYPEAEQRLRQSVADQLSAESLDSLLHGVPIEEAELFKHDLRILKLV